MSELARTAAMSRVPSRIGRLALGILVCVAGAAVGGGASLVSRMAWRSDSLTIPWGMVLALASSAAVVVLGAGLVKPGGFVAAGGWTVAVLVILSWHPGGDFVYASDMFGDVFLGAGIVVVGLTALLSSLATGRPRDRE